MKSLLIAVVALTATFAHADLPRDLKKEPLTKNELRAYKAGLRLAKKLGVAISKNCVNASFEAGTEPVSLQFYSYDAEEGADCGDPHYSIEVEIEKNKVTSVRLIDA